MARAGVPDSLWYAPGPLVALAVARCFLLASAVLGLIGVPGEWRFNPAAPLLSEIPISTRYDRVIASERLPLQVGGVAYALGMVGCDAFLGLGPRVAHADACGGRPFAVTALGPVLRGTVTSILVNSGVIYAGTVGGRVYALTREGNDFAIGGEAQLPARPRRMFISGSTLLITGDIDALFVIDIAKPTQPEYLLEYHLPRGINNPVIRDLAGDQRAIYVLAQDGHNLDNFVFTMEPPAGPVASPNDLTIVAQARIAGADDTTQIEVSGNKIYAMQPVGKLVEIDATQPASLTVLRSWNLGDDGSLGSISDIAVTDEGQVFVSWKGNGGRQGQGRVQMFDQGSIGGRTPSSELARQGWQPTIIAVADGRVISVDGAARSDILSFSSPGTVREIASLDIPLATARSLVVEDSGGLAVASADTGLWHVDSRDAPLALSATPRFSGITAYVSPLDDGGIAGVSRTTLFLSHGTAGEATFTEVSAADLGLGQGTRLHQVQAFGPLVAVVSITLGRDEATGNVTLVDITKRDMPNVLGTTSYEIESTDAPVAVGALGDRLLVAHRLSGPRMFDLGDPKALKQFDLEPSTGIVSDLSADGELMVVAAEDEVTLYEQTDGDSLRKLSSFALPEIVQAVHLRGGRLYVAYGASTEEAKDWSPQVAVLDAGNKFKLRLIETHNLPGHVTDLATSDSQLYLSSLDAGIVSYPLEAKQRPLYLPFSIVNSPLPN